MSNRFDPATRQRAIEASTDPILAMKPIGFWAVDEYLASPRPHIKNKVSPLSAPRNLLSGSRNQFGNNVYWNKGTNTVTAGQTDYEGGTKAARLQGTDVFKWMGTVTWPAGTYTLVGRYKSNTGSPQNFRQTIRTKDTPTIHTATTTWTRFSHTATITSGVADCVLAWSEDGVASLDLLIDELEVYAGSIDLGPEPHSGHMLLGRAPGDTLLSVSGGVLTHDGVGMVSFPSDISFTAYTIMAVGSRTSNVTSHNAILSVPNGSAFTAVFEASAGQIEQPYGTGYTGSTPLYTTFNDGWHVFSHRGSSAAKSFWVDDVKFRVGGAAAGFSLKDVVFNIYQTLSFLSDFSINSWVLFDKALSDAEMAAAVRALKARAARSKIVVPTTPVRAGVMEGDSITASGTYPSLFKPNASPNIFMVNYAVAASTLADVISRATTADQMLPASPGNRKFIYTCLVGANGLATYTGATDAIAAANYLTDLAAHHDARRARGWKTVAITILPISGVAAHNARRAIVNDAIRNTWIGVHCDAVADFGGDATMGTDTSFTDNPTLWTDGTHPNAAGHAVLEPLYRAAVNGI